MVGAFDLETLKRRLSSQMPINSSPNYPNAAVAVVLDDEADASLLLIRRAERELDPWSGQIAFPGGHRSVGDPTLLEAAIREAQEEVGINLRQHLLLGNLPLLPTQSRPIFVAPFVFQLITKVEVHSTEEVAESFWAPLRLLKQMKPEKTEVEIDNRRMVVDSYVYRDHVIWGLTLRILNLLLN